MDKLFTKISSFFLLMCLGIGTSQAQSFCLQMTEVSNDGVNSVVSIGMQGDVSFVIGSSNLQLSFTAGAFGTPSLVSSPLVPPFYQETTVTEPAAGKVSINIELSFSDNSGTIAVSPNYTEIAVINLPITDAVLAANGVTWDYNGGTTATVIFADDETTQLMASSQACLTGFTPNPLVSTNNSCDQAIAVGEGIFINSGSTDGSSATNACEVGATNSTWYAYTPSINGFATVTSSIDLDEPDTRISIHSECNNFDCIAFDDDGGIGFTSLITFEVIGGEDYFIEWDDRWNSDEFDFEISIAAFVNGCMDAEACNYNDAANVDSASCFYASGCDTCSGETDGTGTIITGPSVGDTCDDGDITTTNDIIQEDCNCAGSSLMGCTNINACNYNEFAITNDESCVFPSGCDSCSGETDGTGILIDNPEIGVECNDNDASTIDDIVGEDCICAGSTGGDGTCAAAIGIGEGIILSAQVDTSASGASNACFGGATNAIWYEYTATVTGEVIISSDIDLDEPDTRISVHSACDLLDCLASDDDDGPGFTSSTTLSVVAGENYFLEWDDRWDDGEFDFEIRVALNGCTDFNACNYNSIAETDDDSCVYATGCDICSGETNGSGTVIDNPEVGESCDDGNANTTNDIVQIDCLCAGEPIAFCTDPAACNYNSDLSVQSDNTLCIYASGCDACSGPTDGTGVIIDNPEIGEACDDGDITTVNDIVQANCICIGIIGIGASCSDAIPVTNGTITSIGTGATGGGNASLVCFPGTAAVNSIWYVYTAITCDSVTVSSSIDLDEPDTRLSIHTAGNCATLDCLASDDDSGEGFTSVATFYAEAGTTYYIEWDDRWNDGEFDFEISTPLNICPTDFNADGSTDGEDFSIFLGNFGLACINSCDCPTDLDGNGATDGEDFSIFLGNFELDCPATN